MKAFEWINPAAITEAVQSLTTPSPLADVDDSPRPIAGGQDLLTTMKDYITRPARLVNLKSIRGLDRIEGDARKGLTIGALVTLSELEENPFVKAGFPGLG